jgi:alkanesulfonate monooxygenase SsuD/methylene tetrahydromethanopterin reductase-like flavin-dependent oxidoreductase (luciferase family)
VAFRSLRAGRPIPLPKAEAAAADDRPQRSPANGIDGLRMIVGTPVQIREIFDELLDRSGADELMLMGSTHGVADRIRSYELIGEAFGLLTVAAAR